LAGDCRQLAEVLDLLTALIEQSLVGYEEQEGASRYQFLETVREYSRERLRESGELLVIQGRHLDWCLALAEQAGPLLQGERQEAWLKRLEEDHGNLRAALGWSLEHETVSALRLAARLATVWYVRGYGGEGLEALERGLKRAAEAPSALRAQALDRAGWLARQQGAYGRAQQLLEESVALSRSGDARATLGAALAHLGQVRLCQADHAAARALLEESLSIHRERGEPGGIAWSLHNLSNAVWLQGQPDGARALSEEALGLFRGLGHRAGIAASLFGQGQLARARGEIEVARAFYEESLAIYREMGDKEGTAAALNARGLIAQAEGEYAVAHAVHQESLEICLTGGYLLEAAQALSYLGRVAHLRGEQEQARP
jgi:non-specific serine/threonine protein kinase